MDTSGRASWHSTLSGRIGVPFSEQDHYHPNILRLEQLSTHTSQSGSNDAVHVEINSYVVHEQKICGKLGSFLWSSSFSTYIVWKFRVGVLLHSPNFDRGTSWPILAGSFLFSPGIRDFSVKSARIYQVRSKFLRTTMICLRMETQFLFPIPGYP